ncbi:MAG: peptidyl-prolyl cis-trans isomerase [Pyrinomonadaceae bacterium MAG19_C2-C3]|nr:peptidyl-prolyl cis-trans isomerase [Pyrinomonadaceae bacterium MAG19_C2-C3]
MLKQLSRLKRTQSTFIILFAILLGVSLVFFYAPSSDVNATIATANETVARIGDQEIKVSELEAIKEQYTRIPQGQTYLAQLGGNRGLLDGLVSQRVIAAQAVQLGLGVSDAELAEKLRQQFSDAAGNFIGAERYRRRVGDVGRYEAEQRAALAAAKVQEFVTAGVQISPQQVEEDWKRANTKFELVYVPVVADKLATRLQPSDADIQAFYDKNKSDFAITTPQKKIRYVFINQEKAGANLNFSDEELRAEYERLPAANKQAGVRLQQIVLKIARPDLDDQVRNKALDLIRQARGTNNDDKVSEERFAELARGNSEDPATARNGGALANILRRNPNAKPDDALQSLLQLEPGQISEPKKIGNAYYVFRRGESVPKSFEDAKQELLVSLRNRRAYAAAAQLATRATERLKETKNVEQVARELAAEANMTPAEMIRETDYIKPGDDVQDIGSSPQFEEAVAPLNNTGDVGERVGIRGGFAIPLLIDVRPPRTPELAEVRDQVVKRTQEEQARAQLEARANELAANAESAADLRARAAALGLEAADEKDYTLGSPLGSAGTSAASDAAIFALAPGQVTRTPIKIGDQYVVVAVAARTDADLTEFAKQRDTLTRQALQSAQSQVFGDYITAARRRMEEAGDIKIYDDVLARLAADEPMSPLISPATGGFPAPGGTQDLP